MRIAFESVNRNGIVAEADIHLDGALEGIRITGFVIRNGNDGPWVSFPSRSYEKNGKKEYFDYVRSADSNMAPVKALKSKILDAYEQWSNGR
jgi:hypothetical protein